MHNNIPADILRLGFSRVELSLHGIQKRSGLFDDPLHFFCRYLIPSVVGDQPNFGGSVYRAYVVMTLDVGCQSRSELHRMKSTLLPTSGAIRYAIAPYGV